MGGEMQISTTGRLPKTGRMQFGSSWAVVGAALALLLAALSLVALPADAARAVDPTSTQQRVFTSGEGGYACFRAPAVVKTRDGTLLAFAEGRLGSCSDSGDIDVVMKSLATAQDADWSSVRPVVTHSGGQFFHNVSPVVDENTGNVFLLYTENYKRLHVTISADGGRNWSSDPLNADAPFSTDISARIWDSASMKAAMGGVALDSAQMSFGPASAIQLTHGSHSGRLVAGITVRKGGGKPADLGGALIYKDTDGDWRAGAVSLGAEPAIGAQELSLFERGDGSIFVEARNEEGTLPKQPVYAISGDDGESFQNHFTRFDQEMDYPSSGIQASTLSIREKDVDGYDQVLLALPTSTSRANLTVRSSLDGGYTWQLPSDGMQVWAGPAGYSAMIDLGNSTYGIIFEAGSQDPHEFIGYDTFTEDDLNTSPEALDITLNQNTGALATTDPDQLHLFAPTPTSALGNWFREPDATIKRGIWGTREVTGRTVAFRYGDQQHVLVRGTDGSLVHEFYAPGATAPVTQTWLGAGIVAGAPTGFVDGHQQHAFVRATDGRLLHVWWDANKPSFQQQTWAQPGEIRGDPVSVLYGNQQHVWAVDTDDRLHHWWWSPKIGVQSEVWTGSVKGTPTAFVYRSQLHVYAGDTQDRLAHWWWSTTDGLKRQVLSTPTALGGSPIAFVHGSQQHVYARTVNNTLAHWWWDPTTGNNYGVRAGSIYTDPVAGVFDNTQEVFGAAADSTLHHWWWNASDGNKDESWAGTIATTSTW
ncbi:exo-alpha-sialidase [Streptomyces sp. NBC_00102]|uniref:exo-alpha-sialidase n=1 Tax=Streptomyces sp. NBC_00102 TaxID=2975652 RepID=UPI00225268C5|nr:exo-alpha-sialidase [Streptomyces sp. NBC_00102]MCX5401251.1 exo-alpha-sialidase [Streptomyces sp. NBC_00102]